MTKPGLLNRAAAALVLGIALLGAPAFATAAPAAPANTATPVSTTEAGAAAPTDAVARSRHYAEREAANPRAAAFKGNGAGIYIGGSTLAVVLVVVLIVILL